MNTQATSNPLRTENEAAQFLGVKPTTLQIWRCTKRYNLPYIKIGRLVRYRQSALEAFLVAGTVGEEVQE